jgi:hypothetical protein
MRGLALFLLMTFPFAVPAVAQKGEEDPAPHLSREEKMELVRGLTAEMGVVKTFLPRSRRALEFNADGTWDQAEWKVIGREYGPVARVGEEVQVTKVDLSRDKITLQINGGLNTRGRWYERIEGGMGSGNRGVPLSRGITRSAGTTVALHFPDRVPPLTAQEVKKLLAPVLDFNRRSATENYFDSLPEEIQEAIKAKRAEVGMTRDQVEMAIGRPRDRIRETVDGEDTEDWIYGLPPGKITFVTFTGNKVSRVQDHYAGLGGSVAPPLKTPQ